MMLSLCMIARDEEANLQKHLPRLRAAVDEIVVVDTGSRDRSRQVAHALGARVFELTWKDDFARARNFSLEQARHPWILVLDADETLPEVHFPLLRMIASGTAPQAYRLTVRNYVASSEEAPNWNPCRSEFPEERGLGGWFPGQSVRLFPNRAELRYRFRVQERIEPALKLAGIPVRATGLVVHHFGLLAPPPVVAQRNLLLERLLRRELGYRPDCTTTRWQLARRLARNGKVPAACELYSEVVGKLPYLAEARREFAHLLFRMGRHEEAARQARALLRLRRGIGDGWSILALSRLHLGQAREAMEAAREALRANPWLPQAHYALGLCHLREGDRKQGQAALEAALELDPRHHRSLLRLGRLALQDEDNEQAFFYLSRAVQVLPVCAEAQALLGTACLAGDRIWEAKAHLRRAQSLCPDSPDALAGLAQVHLRENDRENARSLLARVLRINPDHPVARRFLANLEAAPPA